ncbi:MAG TPA: aldose 1-epimerase family protein, partial [Planctomycetota bacterium]|nr:aldose 1-epimerase family protein [Planctomycetota bacterium]
AEPALNGPHLVLEDRLFEKDAIVLQDPKVRELALEAEGSPRKVKLAFTEITWLGIWTKPGAPFICLEPWRGVASAVGDGPDVAVKEGIERLAPGDVFEFDLSITPV